MVQGTVHAGFPSPAADFDCKPVDLNDLLITNPLATFFWRAAGMSMVPAGILEGDILVVDRSVTAAHGDVVVGEIDGDFTVKHFYRRAGRVSLVAADPTFPPVIPKDGQTLVICGVVIGVVRQLRA